MEGLRGLVKRLQASAVLAKNIGVPLKEAENMMDKMFKMNNQVNLAQAEATVTVLEMTGQ